MKGKMDTMKKRFLALAVVLAILAAVTVGALGLPGLGLLCVLRLL